MRGAAAELEAVSHPARNERNSVSFVDPHAAMARQPTSNGLLVLDPPVPLGAPRPAKAGTTTLRSHTDADLDAILPPRCVVVVVVAITAQRPAAALTIAVPAARGSLPMCDAHASSPLRSIGAMADGTAATYYVSAAPASRFDVLALSVRVALALIDSAWYYVRG